MTVELTNEVNTLFMDPTFNTRMTIVTGQQVCELLLELLSLIHITSRL